MPKIEFEAPIKCTDWAHTEITFKKPSGFTYYQSLKLITNEVADLYYNDVAPEHAYIGKICLTISYNQEEYEKKLVKDFSYDKQHSDFSKVEKNICDYFASEVPAKANLYFINIKVTFGNW